MEFTAGTGSEVYLSLLSHLIQEGELVSARGMPTREVRYVTLRILEPGEAHVLRTARRPSAAITATEAIHLIGGLSSLEQLDIASGGRFTAFSDGGRLRGAYGPRLYHQLERAAGLLAEDPGTRQAVASVWNGQENAQVKDVPCTLSYVFSLRGERLHLHTMMRSNDVILGLPFDLEVAGALLKTMTSALSMYGVKLGQVTHTVTSMHLYEADIERAKTIATAAICSPNRAPAPSISPPQSKAVPQRTPEDARHQWSRAARTAEAIVLGEAPDLTTSANPWYVKYVPALPLTQSSQDNWDVCPSCRYVINRNCVECDRLQCCL